MIRIRCLLCREGFRWNTDAGWPEQCPICKGYIGMDDKDEIAAPFISSYQAKNPDRLYREMEQKSEFRAQQAAEMTGMSMTDVSHLKTTNLRDNQREGDTAFVPVVNDVSRTMDAAPQQTGFSPGAASLGLQASAGTSQGPYPNAGTNFIQNVLKPQHNRAHRAPISDMPSLGVRPLRGGR